MYGIFILGTAGCGKSLLTASLAQWMSKKGRYVVSVNLDPGVVWLPYNPDVDIRNYVSIEKLMEDYELGPNGALIMASDIIADQIFNLNREIEELNPEYILVDTAGQMELFAFRVSGQFIVKELKMENKMILYIFDAPFSSNPFNYVSNMFLSAAVFLRFMLPQLNVLSKIDLIPQKTVRQILEWSSTPNALRSAFNLQPNGEMYLLTKDIFNTVSRLRIDFSLVACSAKNFENFVNLDASIQRILTRGEET